MSEYNDFNNTDFPQEPIPQSDLPTDSSLQPEPLEGSSSQPESPKNSASPPNLPEDSTPQPELTGDSVLQSELPEGSLSQSELSRNSVPQPEFPEDSFAPSGFSEDSFSQQGFSQAEFSQNTQPQQGFPQYSSSSSSNSMSTAAMVLGICSIVFICCGGSIIIGTVGIILALLSRGSGTMDGRAKTGLILSIVGLSLCIVIWGAYFIWFMATGLFDQAWDEYNSVPGSDYYEYTVPYDENDHNYDFWNNPYSNDNIGNNSDAKDL